MAEVEPAPAEQPSATASPPSRPRPPLRIAAIVAAVGIGIVAAAMAWGLVSRGPQGAMGPMRVVDEVAVTAMDLSKGTSNTSPVMAADPTELRFVAMATRIEAPDFGCALQLSGDGGRTWVSSHPVRELPPGADKCYAPELAFDARGRLHYLFVGLAGAGNRPMGAFLVTSDDRGGSFSAPREVLGPLRFSVRMAIDRSVGENGRMHVVWIEATSDPSLGGFGPPPNPILSAYSDDGGHTFSEPVAVSEQGRERVVAPALALGPEGSVHVAYYDLGRDALDYQGLEGPVWEEPWSLVLATSSDRGRSFSTASVVDDAITAPERVMLVFTMPPPSLVAGADGLVCAAWTDARHGDPDALLRCSSDDGRRWRPVERLNDDRAGNGAWQYLPRLGLSPDGRLDAVFLDRRGDPRNTYNHVYLTHSDDGGRNIAPNRRISSDPSHTRVGAQYAHGAAKGQYEIGSRLGLLSDTSGLVAAWPDTRHSEPESTSHDLFSATVEMPGPAPPGDGRSLGSVVPGPHVLDVALRDFSFDFTDDVPAGRVLVRVSNAGGRAHSLIVLPLTDDIPPIAEQLRGEERRAIPPFAEVRTRPPGATTTFAVDLEPGVRYAFACFVRDDDGIAHALKGMATEFRAGGARATSPAG